MRQLTWKGRSRQPMLMAQWLDSVSSGSDGTSTAPRLPLPSAIDDIGAARPARGAIIAGTFCPSHNHAKQRAHRLCRIPADGGGSLNAIPRPARFYSSTRSNATTLRSLSARAIFLFGGLTPERTMLIDDGVTPFSFAHSFWLPARFTSERSKRTTSF